MLAVSLLRFIVMKLLVVVFTDSSSGVCDGNFNVLYLVLLVMMMMMMMVVVYSISTTTTTFHLVLPVLTSTCPI